MVGRRAAASCILGLRLIVCLSQPVEDAERMDTSVWFVAGLWVRSEVLCLSMVCFLLLTDD